MLRLLRGDILKADAEALVNTVNCDGFMGRGIAAQFKRAFLANFKAYASACERGEVQPGRMFVFATGQLVNPRWIINFPTKRHWRQKSRLEDIVSGLETLVAEVRTLGVKSIAVPPLGCGLGGLQWDQVRPLIEQAFREVPEVEVQLFEPAGAPATATPSAAPPKMTPGRAVLIELVRRYLAGLMDPFVTLLEVHKLMYFTQESGQPLRLRFTKALYGPYAENLRHVLAEIEGHFVSGYVDGGDAPFKPLELVPGAADAARSVVQEMPELRSRFDRVADLVEGFETPFGLELLASVHWVARHEGAASEAEATMAVHRWSERKQRFSPAQIALAWHTLQAKGWLDAHGPALNGR